MTAIYYIGVVVLLTFSFVPDAFAINEPDVLARQDYDHDKEP